MVLGINIFLGDKIARNIAVLLSIGLSLMPPFPVDVLHSIR
jgi:hypothetical protein